MINKERFKTLGISKLPMEQMISFVFFDKNSTMRSPRQINDPVLNKPRGVWYANGSAWLDHLLDNYGEEFESLLMQYKSVVRLEINQKKVHIIETNEQLEQFIEKFRSESDDLSDDDLTQRTVNWNRVAEAFHGIEFRNVQSISEHHSDTAPYWFTNLDIDSGCIWNVEGLTKVTHIENADSELKIIREAIMASKVTLKRPAATFFGSKETELNQDNSRRHTKLEKLFF